MPFRRLAMPLRRVADGPQGMRMPDEGMRRPDQGMRMPDEGTWRPDRGRRRPPPSTRWGACQLAGEGPRGSTVPLRYRPSVIQPRVGEPFDRYLIEERLGAGGMGEVFRAQDTKLRRQVALKVVRVDRTPGSASAPDGAARLLREARAAAALVHHAFTL